MTCNDLYNTWFATATVRDFSIREYQWLNPFNPCYNRIQAWWYPAFWDQRHPGATRKVRSLDATRLMILLNLVAPSSLWCHNAWHHRAWILNLNMSSAKWWTFGLGLNTSMTETYLGTKPFRSGQHLLWVLREHHLFCRWALTRCMSYLLRRILKEANT